MATAKKRSNAVIGFEQMGRELRFTVGGQTVTLDMARVSQTLLERAIVHGLKQRISDAAAIPCDAATGLPASPEEKFAAIAALVEHYNSGSIEWNRARAVGDGIPRTGNTLQAFANVYWEGDVVKAKEKMEAFAVKRQIEYAAALKIWAGANKIVDEIARMKAAAPAKVDKEKMEAFAAKRQIEYAEAVKIWEDAGKIVEEVALMKAAKVDADSLLDEVED